MKRRIVTLPFSTALLLALNAFALGAVLTLWLLLDITSIP